MAQLNLINVSGAASNAAATVASNTQGDGSSNPCSLILVFDVTLAGGTSPTVQLILEAFDPVSNKFIAWGSAGFTAIAAGTATYIVALSTTMTTGGGVTAVVNLPVPSIWRVRTVAGGTIGTASFTVTAYINMNLQ